MAFKSERIPPIEEETSEFFKQARQILKTGHSRFDAWTVDREHNRVLKRRGCGTQYEERDDEFWVYLNERGRFRFTTRKISYTVLSPVTVALTREIIHFWEVFPDRETIQQIKEAFLVNGHFGIASEEQGEICHHTLLLNGELL